ncbi:UDP-glucosyltransferase 2-like [Planococcus citri]|uniref:UDP-glucosyltransferase 2-like n=1 Tax=Planococcus citri TaxID=170843 RepID=UPI0031F93D76
MEISSIFICTLFVAQIHFSQGLKILGIFPYPSKSHFTFNNAVMKSLIDARHEVTVITCFPDQASQQNYTSIIDISKEELMFKGKPFATVFAKSTFALLTRVMNAERPFCYEIMKLPEIQLALTSNKKLYDVIFVEILLLYNCFLPLAAKFNVPVIGTEAFKQEYYADYSIGNPQHPGYIFFEAVSNRWDKDSFLGRFSNVWIYLEAILFNYLYLVPCLETFHQDHLDQLAPLSKYKDIAPSLIFYNNHPASLSRPSVPNAIEVGCIHAQRAEPLPKDIEKFIDEAVHGVILFSVGSLVKAATMPSKTIHTFREAFAEIPQRVIWKYENRMENVPNNVMLLDWLPQRSILEHKNVKVFISHCGQGGMYEAIYSATPVVSCAITTDQFINANILRKMEAAVQLDITNISKEDILTALNRIINDTKYRTNMEKLSKILKDRPMSPEQSVVYWTEYIARHNGAPHLKTASLQLNWIQYLLLDVIFFTFSIFIIIGSLIYCTFKRILR